jgi:para-nitrobenzyl esterase
VNIRSVKTESTAGLLTRTEYGPVEGIWDRGARCWRGIPYAASLTPQRLFAPPQPPEKWSEPRKCAEYSEICPQKSLLRRNSGADSLSLNIWAPADGERLPVLFFIHGGSLAHGAGSESLYNGARLALGKQLVVVTVNYRLGLPGFADFSDLDSRCLSNNGVRDVLAALAWVSRNIAEFGGDPDAVTLVGQSAGATMVSTLAVMPAAAPYAARAVIMSGGPTQLQGREDCRSFSAGFLEHAGISSYKELTALELSQLMSLQKAYVQHSGLANAAFRLTVDGDLIPEYPIPAAASGRINRIPLLIGTTKEEMSFIQYRPLERSLNVQKIIDTGLRLETEETIRRLDDGYRAAYGPRRSRAMLYTDLLFRISSCWLAESAAASAAVWMYRFDFETSLLRMNGLHAFHSTDLPYLFGNFSSFLVKPMFLLKRDMDEVLAVAEQVQNDFAQFARTGTLPWEQYTAEQGSARCYDLPQTLQSAVPAQIRSLYADTAYRKRSFTPGVNPAPGMIS